MDATPTVWDQAAVIISFFALIGTGVGWWLSSREAKKTRELASEANRIAQESKDIAQSAFEAENIPGISVTVHTVVEFSNLMTFLEGANFSMKPPPSFEKPRPIFIATVKNEKRIPVTVSNAGLRVVGKEHFLAFPREDISEGHRFPQLPRDLQGWQQFEVPVDTNTIRRMLTVLKTENDDRFLVRVTDAIVREYFSPPINANIYLSDTGPVEVTIEFESPMTVTQIGEEVFFPEGIFPAGLNPVEPTDRESHQRHGGYCPCDDSPCKPLAGRTRSLLMIKNQIFRNEAIDLDGKHFVNCRFFDCKLTFSAYEPVKFEGCLFDSCQWVFDGPAENALTFLSALYRGLGTPGTELVEGIFESIRRGGVDKGLLLAEPTHALR